MAMKRILETPRLVLQEMNPRDLDFIADMLAHPEVMQFFDATPSRDEALAWIEKQQNRYAADGHGYWLVLDKSAAQPVGQAGLMKIDLDGVEEIGLGYMLHHPFRHQGFATEAAAACRDYAFEQLAASRLVCPIRPENGSSQRVALRIGMKPGRLTLFAGFDHLIFSMPPLPTKKPDLSAQRRSGL